MENITRHYNFVNKNTALTTMMYELYLPLYQKFQGSSKKIRNLLIWVVLLSKLADLC